MNPHETDYPDDLVTLITKPTEFEANVLVAVLKAADIEAFAFGAMHAVLPMGERLTPVPVQVRRSDFERAQTALKQNVADSVDLDWDEVDVGEREDNLPLTQRESMPWPAKGGCAVAFLTIAIMMIGALVMMIVV